MSWALYFAFRTFKCHISILGDGAEAMLILLIKGVGRGEVTKRLHKITRGRGGYTKRLHWITRGGGQIGSTLA